MKRELKDLLPHREPMLLIDSLESVADNEVECSVVITESSAFCGEDGVPSYVGIEYIAQSIAAYSGCFPAEDEPGLGFLLGSRSYKATRAYFKIGDHLRVIAKKNFVEKGLGSFSGEIYIGSEKVVEASLTTFKPNSAQLKQLKEDL